MARKLSHSVSCRSILCLFLLGWLAAQLPTRFDFSHPQARPQGSPQARLEDIRVVLNVVNTSLPVTIGVPLSEAAAVTNATQLGVVDAAGNAVPSQMRVLTRWSGEASDTRKAIKWLLVDFRPSAAGAHFLMRAAQTTGKLVSAIENGSAIRITNSQLEIEIPKTGEALIKSFRAGGGEMLRAPISAQMTLPRRAIVNQLGASSDTATVTDTTLLRVGDEVRFEHVGALKWDAAAGGSRLVTFNQSFVAGRRYRVGEGTPQDEEVAVSAAQPGDLKTDAPLRFNHPAGTTIRDLSIEQERTTIKTISGRANQVVQFTSALKAAHAFGEKMIAVNAQGQPDVAAMAIVEKTTIEEANALRVVIRQDGAFRITSDKTNSNINSSSAPATAALAFSVRYYVYADQPFVRVRWRMMNNGAYGFGASRGGPSPFAQHAILRSLSVLMPTVAAASGNVLVLTADDAHARLAKKQSGASLAAGATGATGATGAIGGNGSQFEISVPEFVENYPKALQSTSQGNGQNGLRFDILPDTGSDYIFDGARAKTTDFYLGRNTIAARALTGALNATLEPAYIAATGAVRPAFVERRNWSAAFPKDPQMGEAATRTERMLASAYAVEATEAGGSVPPSSAFEYRLRGENGEQFGWRNFGDLAWGDGYANVHYDLPFVVLREALRTGDARAFQLGSEMARYRADWGQFRADDYLDSNWNLRGTAFYEKGDHGTFREPVPSHSWIEGMWLYWALTGDEAMRESALEGSEAFARMSFTYGSGLSWNEPRWVGWPALGLVVAYRYTGDQRYLNKAREDINLLIQTEENYGRKGFYLAQGGGVTEAVQPWAWTGYAQLGVIEYWRETNDSRAADYIVRIADWMISKDGKNPPLKPGVALPGLSLNDGNYLPSGMSYFWVPDKIAEDRSLGLGALGLPVLAAAARITNRDDLKERAKQLFQDFAFYRDLPEGQPTRAAARAVINFRSVLYAGSSPKVYGQMGLTISDYLPELTGSIVRPNALPLGPTPRRDEGTVPITVPTTAPPVAPSATVNASTLVNVALKRPATASSTRVWPNTISTPDAANDGEMSVTGKNSIWHSDSNTNKLEWWQVELGRGYRINIIEILFRADLDQPSTRRNFEVRGSNDPNFGSSALLAAQGDAPAAFGQPWRAQVNDAGSYRYVRVQKTKIDRDPTGQSFFNLGEVRLLAQNFQSSPQIGPTPTPPGIQALTLAQVKARRMLIGQRLNFLLTRQCEGDQMLQLFAYNLPANARFNEATGEFLFTPNSTQAGEVYQITFRALDVQQADSFARMDVAVMIDGAPNITLLAPVSSSRLTIGQPTLISWSTSHSTTMAKYQIRLSTDGGVSYPTVIADLIGSANQYQWAIPNFSFVNRSAVRLMVKGTDAQGRVGVDYSRQDLRISLGSPQR